MDRERKSNRRRSSSILKRQDVFSSEGSDGVGEGPRTPKRVSFANTTSVRTFWKLHMSDESSNSTGSNPDVSAISEASHSDPDVFEQDAADPSSAHLPVTGHSQPHDMLATAMDMSARSVEWSGGRELAVSDQGQTIMFSGVDDPGCNMELTSNISQFPAGDFMNASDPKPDAVLSCKPGFSRTPSFSGERSPEEPTEHDFMEMTRNITSDLSVPVCTTDVPESTRIFHLQDNNDMELTQNMTRTFPNGGQAVVFQSERTQIFGETGDGNTMELTKNITSADGASLIQGEMGGSSMFVKSKSKYSTLDDLFAAVKRKSSNDGSNMADASNAGIGNISASSSPHNDSLNDMEMTGDLLSATTSTRQASLSKQNTVGASMTDAMKFKGSSALVSAMSASQHNDSLEDMEMTGDLSTAPSRQALAEIPAHKLLTPVMEMSVDPIDSRVEQGSMCNWQSSQTGRSVSGKSQQSAMKKSGIDLDLTVEKENSILEAYRNQVDIAMSEGNRTVMFGGPDNSMCDMDMTSNISQLPPFEFEQKSEHINESQLSVNGLVPSCQSVLEPLSEHRNEVTNMFGQTGDSMEITKNVDGKLTQLAETTPETQQGQRNTQGLSTQVFGQSNEDDDDMEITFNMTRVSSSIQQTNYMGSQTGKENGLGSTGTAQDATESLSNNHNEEGEGIEITANISKDAQSQMDLYNQSLSSGRVDIENNMTEEKQKGNCNPDLDASLKSKQDILNALSSSSQSFNESVFLEDGKSSKKIQEDFNLSGDLVRGMSRSALKDISINVVQTPGKETVSILNMSKDQFISHLIEDDFQTNQIIDIERALSSVLAKQPDVVKSVKKPGVSFSESNVVKEFKTGTSQIIDENGTGSSQLKNEVNNAPKLREHEEGTSCTTSDLASTKPAHMFQGKRRVLHTSEVLKLDPSCAAPKKRRSSEVFPLSWTNGSDALRKSRHRKSEAFPAKNVFTLLGNRRKSTSDVWASAASSSSSSSSEENKVGSTVTTDNEALEKSLPVPEKLDEIPDLSFRHNISSTSPTNLVSGVGKDVASAPNNTSMNAQSMGGLNNSVTSRNTENRFNSSSVGSMDPNYSPSQCDSGASNLQQSMHLTAGDRRQGSEQNSSRVGLETSSSNLMWNQHQISSSQSEAHHSEPSPLSSSQLEAVNADLVPPSPLSDLDGDFNEDFDDQKITDMIQEDSFTGVEELLSSLQQYASNKEPFSSADSQARMELTFDTMCTALDVHLDAIPVKNVAEQSQITVSTEKDMLEAKMFTQPKVECLKDYIAQLEKDAVRSKQEVEKKIAQLNQSPPEWFARMVRSECTEEDTSDMKSKAQVAAQTCRKLCKAQWNHRKADFLMKYCDSREDAHTSLKAQVENVVSETENLQGLISQVDQHLRDIKASKAQKQEMTQRQEELQEAQREVKELRLKCENEVRRLSDIKASNTSVASRLQETETACDQLEEQLTWLSSLTEWSILHRSGTETQFGFLFNTVVLCVQTTSPSDKDRKILGITRRSRLAACSRPWAKLSHDLVVSSLDCNKLQQKYKDYSKLGQLLSEVSAIVCKARHFSQELKLVHLEHELSIDRKNLTVVVRDRGTRRKVQLEATLSGWPKTGLQWTLSSPSQSEDIRLNDLEEEIKRVTGGPGCVSRVVSKVKDFLSKTDQR